MADTPEKKPAKKAAKPAPAESDPMQLDLLGGIDLPPAAKEGEKEPKAAAKKKRPAGKAKGEKAEKSDTAKKEPKAKAKAKAPAKPKAKAEPKAKAKPETKPEPEPAADAAPVEPAAPAGDTVTVDGPMETDIPVPAPAPAPEPEPEPVTEPSPAPIAATPGPAPMAVEPAYHHHWLVRPRTIGLLWRYGILLLAGLTVLDLVIEPHPYFGLDGTFGFHAWFGFAACAAMVIGAKLLGIFLKRADTYYDREPDQ